MEQKKLNLIREYNDFSEFDVFEESTGDDEEDTLKFRGPFLKANVQNRNDRVYPMEELRPAVEQYKEEKIDKRQALGELGHPDNVEINLERVCHLVEDINWQGNTGIGVAEVFDDFGMGRIAAGLIKRRVMLGVSTRGLGELQEDSDGYTVTDYHLVAIDCVHDPSTPGAFVEGIKENKQYILEDYGDRQEFRQVENAYDALESELKSLPKKKREKALRKSIETFFDELKADM